MPSLLGSPAKTSRTELVRDKLLLLAGQKKSLAKCQAYWVAPPRVEP